MTPQFKENSRLLSSIMKLIRFFLWIAIFIQTTAIFIYFYNPFIFLVIESFLPSEFVLEIMKGLDNDPHQWVALFSGNIMQQLLLLGGQIQVFKILSNIQISQTPFSDTNSKHLRILSYFVALITFLPVIIHDIVLGWVIPFAESNVQISFSFAIIAILIYTLSSVFDYGVQLQKQADETL